MKMKSLNIFLSIAVLCAFSSAFGGSVEVKENVPFYCPSWQYDSESDCLHNCGSYSQCTEVTDKNVSGPGCWSCYAGASKSSDTYSHITALKTK